MVDPLQEYGGTCGLHYPTLGVFMIAIPYLGTSGQSPDPVGAWRRSAGALPLPRTTRSPDPAVGRHRPAVSASRFFESRQICAVCRVFASARRKRRKPTKKGRKIGSTTFSPEVLRRFLCACKSSANSKYFGRLKIGTQKQRKNGIHRIGTSGGAQQLRG